MRISVPHIPKSILDAASETGARTASLELATQCVASFLKFGNTAILTGAGVSVDSGIRAYRGKDGRYMNPHYRQVHTIGVGLVSSGIQHHELIEDSPKGQYFRQRYWQVDQNQHTFQSLDYIARCRSYLGYPPVARAQPNPTHFAIAALQYSSHIKNLITQNVDGLHIKARPLSWSDAYSSSRILELHGTLHTVKCRREHTMRRELFQNLLSASNPRWKAYVDELEATGQQPRTNPDGDVELLGATYDDFVIPPCETCLKTGRRETNIKPALTFFGDTVTEEVKNRSFREVDDCHQLLLVGTTLATYSAFRLFKRALELRKPILILNVGPTRADPYLTSHADQVEKVEWRSGEVLKAVALFFAGQRGTQDKELDRLLSSGVVTPIDASDDDRAPRAAG